MRRCWVWAACFVLVAVARPLIAAPLANEGQPLVEVLAALEAHGLDIIYSNDLITPSMTVREPLIASEPLEVLREILRPYGLGIRPGPQDAWLVVRESAVTPAPPSLVRGSVPPKPGGSWGAKRPPRGPPPAWGGFACSNRIRARRGPPRRCACSRRGRSRPRRGAANSASSCRALGATA
jgi:hypothetical protein